MYEGVVGLEIGDGKFSDIQITNLQILYTCRVEVNYEYVRRTYIATSEWYKLQIIRCIFEIYLII